MSSAVLRDQDSSYELRFSYRANQATVVARYMPLGGGAKQPLKIELATRESVPILGSLRRISPRLRGRRRSKSGLIR